MKCAQHAAHNPKFDGHKKFKGPAHMVEGGHEATTIEKPPAQPQDK